MAMSLTGNQGSTSAPHLSGDQNYGATTTSVNMGGASDGGNDHQAGGENSSTDYVIPGEITVKQKAILAGALFMKGGLLGAFIPFVALWTHLHGYTPTQVGFMAAADICFSILLVPLFGGILDTWKCHNWGLVIAMSATGALKFLYIVFADSFWMLLFLTALTAPCLKGCNSVLDAQCLYAFKDKAQFGQVRLFGNFGFGILAALTGLFVAAGTSEAAPYERVDKVFVAFAVICFASSVYWAIMHKYVKNVTPDADRLLRERSIYAEFKALVAQIWNTEGCPRVVCALFILGCQLGIIGAYEFIMLSELNAGVDFMGACRLFGMIFEIPVWIYGMQLVDQISLPNAQILFLCVNSIRLYWYGVLTQPMEAMYAEVMAGFSFAFPYLSITVYIGRQFAEGRKASMQSILHSTFTGLGTGMGSVLGGFLIDAAFGGNIQALFRYFAGATFLIAIVFGFYDNLHAIVAEFTAKAAVVQQSINSSRGGTASATTGGATGGQPVASPDVGTKNKGFLDGPAVKTPSASFSRGDTEERTTLASASTGAIMDDGLDPSAISLSVEHPSAGGRSASTGPNAV
ncbi:unnamed protein product [Amoebophrya sp. A120]|nr:unnamed protein product [Amoebophrya sp. A120]|eukprot:GSA120T00018747001.1